MENDAIFLTQRSISGVFAKEICQSWQKPPNCSCIWSHNSVLGNLWQRNNVKEKNGQRYSHNSAIGNYDKFLASPILPVGNCDIIWMKDYSGIKNGRDVYYVNSWKYLHLEQKMEFTHGL